MIKKQTTTFRAQIVPNSNRSLRFITRVTGTVCDVQDNQVLYLDNNQNFILRDTNTNTETSLSTSNLGICASQESKFISNGTILRDTSKIGYFLDSNNQVQNTWLSNQQDATDDWVVYSRSNEVILWNISTNNTTNIPASNINTARPPRVLDNGTIYWLSNTGDIYQKILGQPATIIANTVSSNPAILNSATNIAWRSLLSGSWTIYTMENRQVVPIAFSQIGWGVTGPLSKRDYALNNDTLFFTFTTNNIKQIWRRNVGRSDTRITSANNEAYISSLERDGDLIASVDNVLTKFHANGTEEQLLDATAVLKSFTDNNHSVLVIGHNHSNIRDIYVVD